MLPRYSSPSRAPSYKEILEAEAERRGVTVSEFIDDKPQSPPPKKLNIKFASWKDAWAGKMKQK